MSEYQAEYSPIPQNRSLVPVDIIDRKTRFALYLLEILKLEQQAQKLTAARKLSQNTPENTLAHLPRQFFEIASAISSLITDDEVDSDASANKSDSNISRLDERVRENVRHVQTSVHPDVSQGIFTTEEAADYLASVGKVSQSNDYEGARRLRLEVEVKRSAREILISGQTGSAFDETVQRDTDRLAEVIARHSPTIEEDLKLQIQEAIEAMDERNKVFSNPYGKKLVAASIICNGLGAILQAALKEQSHHPMLPNLYDSYNLILIAQKRYQAKFNESQDSDLGYLINTNRDSEYEDLIEFASTVVDVIKAAVNNPNQALSIFDARRTNITELLRCIIDPEYSLIRKLQKSI